MASQGLSWAKFVNAAGSLESCALHSNMHELRNVSAEPCQPQKGPGHIIIENMLFYVLRFDSVYLAT